MKILFALLIMAAFSGLSACNTFEGLGKDIESLGKGIQDESAEEKKKK